MPRVTVSPMLGKPRRARAESLLGCHMLFEISASRNFQSPHLERALGEAVREAMLSDYVRALLKRDPDSGVNLVVTIQAGEV